MSGSRVGQAWTATYADPIRVAVGEAVTLDRPRDRWDGHVWLWARASDRPEGWLPDAFSVRTGDDWRVPAACDARELTCAAGDLLTCLERTHGWALCRAPDGRQGWVPLRNLTAPPTPDATIGAAR